MTGVTARVLLVVVEGVVEEVPGVLEGGSSSSTKSYSSPAGVAVACFCLWGISFSSPGGRIFLPDLLFFFWLLLLLECSPPPAAAALAGVLVEVETAEGAEVLLVEAALVEGPEVPRDCFSAFEAAAEVPFLLLGVAEVDDAELLLLFSGVSLSRSPLFAVDEVDEVAAEDLLDEVLALVLLSLLLAPLPAVEVLELLIEVRFPLLLLVLVGAGADEVVVVEEEATELALFSVVFSALFYCATSPSKLKRWA
ncbi:hypothetical protein TYRP_006138 [Tyrophagus putrescentiae]|nr:hypothetical protein TYRP_006138 [Tyrophagus putrescentiae]